MNDDLIRMPMSKTAAMHRESVLHSGLFLAIGYKTAAKTGTGYYFLTDSGRWPGVEA